MAGADSTPAVCTPTNFVKAIRKVPGPAPVGEGEARAETGIKTRTNPKRRRKRKVRSVWAIPGGGIETNRRKH